MRILTLRCTNLNSLYGSWEIDFTKPELGADTIFAITGPTGAGKSTILDGICLALYGCTPRLEKITRSANNIMSRRTGFCSAEVTFECVDGVYRCFWSQHRARKKADGRLAEALHEISEVSTGTVLHTKKREVLRLVEEKTGMDFDRFKRSVMLAQGGFDSFLRAKPDERAPLLEQITGTEIYSNISREVHERLKQEKNSLLNLQSVLEAITLLTEEEQTELTDSIARLTGEERALHTSLLKIREGLQWYRNLDQFRQEISRLQKGREELQQELKAATPQKKRLEQAIRAAELEPDWVRLDQLRKAQQEEEQGLKALLERAPGLQEKLGRLREGVHDAQQALENAKNERKKTMPVLTEVRGLDLKLHERRSRLGELGDELRLLTERDQKLVSARKETDRRITVQRELLEKNSEYRRCHAGDEQLAGRLDGLRERIDGWIARSWEVAGLTKELDGFDKRFSVLTLELKGVQKKHQQAGGRLEKIRRERNGRESVCLELLQGRSLRELREHREMLQREVGLLRRISDLESERKHLVDGQPCPLCGSVKHPFDPDYKEDMGGREKELEALGRLITRVEGLEQEIQGLDKEESNLKQSLLAIEKEQVRYQTTEESWRREHDLLQEKKREAEQQSKAIYEKIRNEIRGFGINEISPETIRALLSELEKRRDRWKSLDEEKHSAEKCVARLETEGAAVDAQREALAVELREKKAAEQKILLEGVAFSKERKRLFGVADPDQESTRLEETEARAELHEKNAIKLYEETRGEVKVLQSRLDELQESCLRRSPLLEQADRDFLEASRKAGFDGEQECVAAQMKPSARKELEETLRRLEDSSAELNGRWYEKKEGLAAEERKAVTDMPEEELNRHLQEQEQKLKDIGERLGGYKQKLETDQKSREQLGAQLEKIELQQKVCQRWVGLDGLIGSADGKKFRNFAQGLTFELMVDHANRQLVRMSDRYLLVRDKEMVLELNVVDNYQAGEVRTTKNLSGGESFLVSLALALGLSAMASRKVRVDSLFLDEGFGTLDEESLDTALECLASLQQEDKLVGIISHVGALKERIGARIEVIPMSGGKSRIQGPGCSLISID